MKKLDKSILVLAIIMIIPIFWSLFVSVWDSKPQTKKILKQSHIEQISKLTKYEFASEENIRTCYYPGFLIADPHLFIYIENIESEDSFFSRFGGEKVKANETILDMYKIENYICELSVSNKNDEITAQLSIIGHFQEEIYGIVYNEWLNLFSPYFIVSLVVELFFVVFLIVRQHIRKRESARADYLAGQGSC